MKRLEIPILRLPYSAEDMDYIKSGIEEVLRSGYLTMGVKVARFEEEFAAFVGSKYALATNSGTSSLEIILRALGVTAGSVVVPSNTFLASAVAVAHAGAGIIFADCQKENLQLDPDDLRKRIRPDTRAVMIVHIGGIISPAIEAIRRICDENGLFLIEDAAHAHGASISGRAAGTLGIAASFSFYPTKVLTTAEGGMITTDDDDLYHRAVSLRDHGRTSLDSTLHTELGYNWRFSELHAVLGLQQMKRAEDILAERRKIARRYDEKLAGVPRVRKLEIPPGVTSSYYKYIVFVDDDIDRDVLKKKLREECGVWLTGEVYANPCHLQPVFQSHPEVLSAPLEPLPQTEYIASRHICLPLYPGLSEEEVDYVVDSLAGALR